MITEKDLTKIRLRKPSEAGEYWQGIPHDELISTFRELCVARGFTAGVRNLELSKDKADIVATMVVRETTWEIPPGFDAIVVIKNSNARRWGLSFTLGIQHREDKTILVVGRQDVARRRGTLPWKETIHEALGLEFPWLMKRAPKMVERMTGAQIEPSGWALILMRLAQGGIISWQWVSHIAAKIGVLNGVTEWALACFIDQEVATASPIGRRDQVEIRFELTKALFWELESK